MLTNLLLLRWIYTHVRRRPGFIAGVTNPIFEHSGAWDLLCDVGSGRMVVSKDIYANYPTNPIFSQGPLIMRTGTLRAEGSAGSEEDVGRPSRDIAAPQKAELSGKADSSDNLFMEDVSVLVPLGQSAFGIDFGGSRFCQL